MSLDNKPFAELVIPQVSTFIFVAKPDDADVCFDMFKLTEAESAFLKSLEEVDKS
ncbi:MULTISPECIES: hypothetical protein [Pseudomonas syringae group]|uniref:hypothetical protein n=1 Tax=Pseudomonas syringae group TaxID=136849 RepID=UPI0006CCBD67|nr:MULTISPECIES: hypothetical protein [Pseudomonas syringae group]KPB82061.1 Unknown protein sequence [Pseudomonas syringae pv. maculicola]NAP32495.1 hypothetical protein [Pseudomonas syringae]